MQVPTEDPPVFAPPYKILLPEDLAPRICTPLVRHLLLQACS